MKILSVIPARGGSKGIPRKNLRLLGGKPLIQYALEATLKTTEISHVVVTSDDLEIQLIAEKMGAFFIKRDARLCSDHIPLDPVVYDAYMKMKDITCENYDLIITVQPTSPFISNITISKCIEKILSAEADTLISVIEDTHLGWKKDKITGAISPNYLERLNRQWLPKTYKETGSIQICNNNVITESNRIGEKIALYELDECEGIDIDTPLNWKFCESIVARKRYVFVVTGNGMTGTGHAYRAKTIADYLAGDETIFLCTNGSDVAYAILEKSNLNPIMLDKSDLVEQVISYPSDIVINDILDTTPDYIRELQNAGKFVVNFEDLGEGAITANLVINALYSSQNAAAHVLSGGSYFCLRGEFSNCAPYQVKDSVKRILLTFGGTDPSNLTVKTLLSIDDWCAKTGIEIEIIPGPSYMHWNNLDNVMLECKSAIHVSKEVQVMSYPMKRADICFTSCGRTIYELASLGVPTICMAQNQREEKHTFARLENGINYLGLGKDVNSDRILSEVKELYLSYISRKMMHEVMKKSDFKNGTSSVMGLIDTKYLEWKNAK